ncbi:LysR family transcriptional regulator [Brachybacterium sp. J144]|uniref:LysR family transcriptional regulator n=1 Tax=Brachybacterium sp. J144 TaxID=3116487 RepID=UPI002E776964|nr:LysR family transcriptional regulator [Brachybacterium sp. J144]MEE1650278.1 LysR family transcriptional regulator [Brachybacterium sp. J144]
MPRIEQTDWLETFVAVIDHGSFSAAARALHRAQSRVSTHVASLERALGGTLVDRSHRPIGLTELGAAFLPHAREVLDALQRGADTVDRHTDTPRGTVVIGCHPSVSAGFLPGVLAAVHARHPLIRIELSERTTQDLVSGVLSGRYHLAIHSLAGDPPPPELQSEPLWSERFVALTPPDHPLLDARDPVTGDLPPAAIPEHPLIAVALPGAEVDPDTGSALGAWGLSIPVAWQTEQPQTVVELARAGLGVGVLNGLAAAISATEGMAITPVGTLEQGRHVAVTRDRRTASSPSVEAVLAAILAAPVPAGVRRTA